MLALGASFNCSELFQCSRLSREIHSSGSACEGLDSVALKQMKEFRRSRDRMLHEAMKDKPDLRSAFESHYLEV